MRVENVYLDMHRPSFRRLSRQLREHIERFRTTGTAFFKYGMPFITLLLGGVWGVKEIQEIKFVKSDTQRNIITGEELEDFVKVHKQQKSLYELLADEKKKKLDSWENIRGPELDEDSKAMQNEQRKKLGLPLLS